MKKTIFLFISFLFIGKILVTACSEMLEVNPPISRIVSQQVFENDQTAMSALYGLYGSFAHTAFFPSQYNMASMSSDEIIWTRANQPILFEFESNSLTPKNGQLNSYFWNPSYKIVYEANNILTGIANNKNLSTSIKSQLESETKAIRAYVYHYLLNVFGDVPLVCSNDYLLTRNLPRADSSGVYQLIISDLNDALSMMVNLPVSSDRTRIDQYTVSALLARCYLYQGEWQKALDASTKVLESSLFALQTDLNKVFENSNNKETIFQQYIPKLESSSIDNTPYAIAFIPASPTAAFPNYTIRKELFNAFTPSDKRKEAWMNSITSAGTTYYYPFKYKIRKSEIVKEYPIVIRFAEILLLRAEAYAELNQLDLAIIELDKIRERAGLSAIKNIHHSITKKALLDSVFIERQRELFTEFGHRWFDLKRSGRANSVYSKIANKDWQSTDILYPIPSNQMLANPFLTQNPGYETY